MNIFPIIAHWALNNEFLDGRMSLSVVLGRLERLHFSINNLAQALSCSYATVGVWLDALEQVYMIFRVPPYSTKLVRTIQKEKKVCFWDWRILENEGKRFENFLALQLFRSISA